MTMNTTEATRRQAHLAAIVSHGAENTEVEDVRHSWPMTVSHRTAMYVSTAKMKDIGPTQRDKTEEKERTGERSSCGRPRLTTLKV
jgi:hypothetical protein